ncbi:MAG: DinB family protein [Vicinamibacteria bacterium]
MTNPDHASDVSKVICTALSQQCERVRLRIHQLVEPLTHEQLWTKPYPYGNSVGHLLLHVTGNLRNYIGAGIANSGYVRDRPKEFADDSKREKDAVMSDFEGAVAELLATARAQSDADWGKPYDGGMGVEDIDNRLSIFIRCAAHLDHHMGQMIYLCKQLAL